MDEFLSTNEQRQAALLAFAGVLGGGLVAYEAGRSLREGDLFKTDPTPAEAEVGLVAGTAGLVALAYMYQEAAKDVGWRPLILGSVGIFAAAITARALRR